MSTIKIVVGKVYERLTVVERVENSPNGRTRWLCRCECGRFATVAGSHLNCGNIKSCGCLRGEFVQKRATNHGFTNHPFYGRWAAIVQRCCSPTSCNYVRYGARGIKLHPEWRQEPGKFIQYFIDMYPNLDELIAQKYQIDRINNDGNYEPGNVRLVTPADNMNNRGGLKKNKSILDLTGQRFGRLVALEIAGKHVRGRLPWKCLCDCGNEKVVRSSLLTNGNTRSCGCLAKESTQKTHGLRNHPLFTRWAHMRQRAKRDRTTVAEEWSDFKVFYDWAQENGWKEDPNLKLVRIKTDEPFGPSNCEFSLKWPCGRKPQKI